MNRSAESKVNSLDKSLTAFILVSYEFRNFIGSFETSLQTKHMINSKFAEEKHHNLREALFGGIQQLSTWTRREEGGSAKSPRLSTQVTVLQNGVKVAVSNQSQKCQKLTKLSLACSLRLY